MSATNVKAQNLTAARSVGGSPPSGRRPGPSLLAVLAPYRGWIISLIVLTVLANTLTLAVPRVVAQAIDDHTAGHFNLSAVIIEFVVIMFAGFAFNYLQGVVQTYAAEKVARDLRNQLIGKIAQHDYAFVQEVTAAKLLTNLTSDIDAVKNFVAQAVSSLISSLFLIVGAAILLLITEWQLALVVLSVVPIIGGAFYVILGQVRVLFREAQGVIDWLNKVINESILGAALIRLLNAQEIEHAKFDGANERARQIGMRILARFALLIPIVVYASSLAILAILLLGGHYVIIGTLSLGQFTAFNAYLVILIFPIIIIGFTSNVIAQASASYARVTQVLNAPIVLPQGINKNVLHGDVEVRGLSIRYENKSVVDDISLTVKAGTRTAIIGPTAAGKSQLLYALTGLLTPSSGEILIDGLPLEAYDKMALHQQIGFVFQDSSLFNLTLRENIAFSNTVDDHALDRAIATAQLTDFIHDLPHGLDTIVSERGTTLSGGQKQRVMLARALALNPKILLLDDFTARVDTKTEQAILANVRCNYPDLTLISVTQKIAPIVDYDQIILMMEGAVLARGTHAQLMQTSPEYVQIFRSQQSTETYELQD